MRKSNALVELGKKLLNESQDLEELRSVAIMLYAKLEEQDEYIENLENILNSNTNLH